MLKLVLKFEVNLENPEFHWHDSVNGPIFHRWLPDGKKNSINIPTIDKRNKLEIWFNRMGYVSSRGTFIEYDKNRAEIDPKIMSSQAKLEAGNLFGEAVYSNLTKAEFEAITKDQIFIQVPSMNFLEYLKEDDWKDMQKINWFKEQPSLATVFLGQANHNIDQKNFRQAFIDATTAMEFALRNFIDSKLDNVTNSDQKNIINKAINRFYDLPLKSKVAVILLNTNIDEKENTKTIEAINIRNKIVHDGYVPNKTKDIDNLKSLMSSVAELINHKGIKFPNLTFGSNLSYSIWKKD